jgi:hypothetical protein
MSKLFSYPLNSRRGRLSPGWWEGHGPKQLHTAKEFTRGSVPYN